MCCLFGIMDNNGSLTSKQKTRLIRALAAESEVRGTDAAGIAYNSGGKLQICKGPGPARKHRFFVPGDARVVMGHTRMTTQGDAKYPQNNHPFAGKVGRLHFALAHNGVLYNDKSLRKSKKLPQTNIQTDSYVAVQLLEQQGALTPDSLSKMAETVEGSFVFTVLDHKDRLYLVKGDNPLTIWHYPRLGLYIYASTLAILHQAVNRTWLAGEGQAWPDHGWALCDNLSHLSPMASLYPLVSAGPELSAHPQEHCLRAGLYAGGHRRAAGGRVFH